MPFNRVQGATNQDFSGGGLASLSSTLAAGVASGSLVCGHVTCSNGVDFSAVTDDKGNSYTLVSTGGNDTTNGQRAAMFYKENVTNGPTVFTVTFVGGASTNYVAITADEFSGVATASALTGTPALNVQNSPGTGANVITAPSITPGEAGALIYACTQNDGGSTLATAGSGFTSGTSNATAACRSEWLTHTSGAIVATFGIAANESHITGVMAFKAAAGGGSVTADATPTLAAVTLGADATVDQPGQIAAPVADIAAGAWLASSGSDLYTMLDESAASDSDYIYITAAGSIAEIKLAGITDPSASTGHKLSYRLQALTGQQVRVTLRQGAATTIAQWMETGTGAPATVERTLSGAEADAITDYTDLRVRFEAL